uniref:Chlorophyll a-b binding protein, chloroplastic n=1 Tax=Tetradesmus obliquus TaxID=3088 RepID=A0A383WNZ7_TETOB|eukprot:jgi/Sobl393_1/20114/SZX79187.1
MALLAKSGVRAAGVSRRSSVACRAQVSRPTWYPGATPPQHLDGSMLGDYGFDPLRLGTNPESLKWYREGELYNGRWAMAAVAGILFTDLVGLPKFWLAGAEQYPIDNKVLLAIEVVVMAILEGKRYEGYKKTGECGFLGSFPFDPMGMRSEKTKLNELKNGRLAMLAFIGFCSQAAVRGLGPIDCLKLHLEDPWNNNIFTSSVGPESVVTVALLCVWPIIIEATKSLNKGKPESVPVFPWAEPWNQQ